jgi:hypothetical protein
MAFFKNWKSSPKHLPTISALLAENRLDSVLDDETPWTLSYSLAFDIEYLFGILDLHSTSAPRG